MTRDGGLRQHVQFFACYREGSSQGAVFVEVEPKLVVLQLDEKGRCASQRDEVGDRRCCRAVIEGQTVGAFSLGPAELC
jgi:hypothetical protein